MIARDQEIGGARVATLCRLRLGFCPFTRKNGARMGPDWDWDWVTQGSRLGRAWATQASRLGHPWVELNKYFCLQRKLKKAGWAIGKTKSFYHRGHEGTQRKAKSGTPPRAAVPHGNRGHNGKVTKRVK